MVQWYPGHIAKAERDLREQLKAVDMILEVGEGRQWRLWAKEGCSACRLGRACLRHAQQHSGQPGDGGGSDGSTD